MFSVSKVIRTVTPLSNKTHIYIKVSLVFPWFLWK